MSLSCFVSSRTLQFFHFPFDVSIHNDIPEILFSFLRLLILLLQTHGPLCCAEILIHGNSDANFRRNEYPIPTIQAILYNHLSSNRFCGEYSGPHHCHLAAASFMLGTLKWMHFQVQTKSIAKQFHKMSEVLLPPSADTQPTRPSLVSFCAGARIDKDCVTGSG
jgi:hypothetical protein